MTTHDTITSTSADQVSANQSTTISIVTAEAARARIDGHRGTCLEVIEQAYLTHAAGSTVLPHSTFVRPDLSRPDRFIALPGYFGGNEAVAGMKWIASYPDNLAAGLDRASAVLVLNDTGTGYPFAVMEGSVISATRTAASAVLAAERLLGRRRAGRVGIIGTGLIAEHVHLFLRELGWDIGGYTLHDRSPARAEQFANRLRESDAVAARVAPDYAEVFDDCELVVLATTATTPYLHDPALLSKAPVVLHLSLRDLGPQAIGVSQNITDDVDHAVREDTSLHVARQAFGPMAGVVDGTIADVLTGRLVRDGRAAVFSPFGLGVLDLALGRWVYERCRDHDGLTTVPGFFPEADR